jgi:hypothetical protein
MAGDQASSIFDEAGDGRDRLRTHSAKIQYPVANPARLP